MYTFQKQKILILCIVLIQFIPKYINYVSRSFYKLYKILFGMLQV